MAIPRSDSFLSNNAGIRRDRMSGQFDEISSTLAEFATAWKANDGSALAGFFAEDGTLVNPFGQRADGRHAVAGMYSDYFGGMLAGTSTSITLDTVRDLGGQRAFVDGKQTIVGSDGSEILAVHLAALLQREDAGWRLVDARPYTYAAAPV